ncbi:hypothetical protein V8C86DRAFT_2751570 [Haematococcus lacustris]
MGNAQGSHGFMDRDPDFKAQATAGWRSARARELDELGGLDREPVALGSSFDARMHFLGEQLQERGEQLQEILAPTSLSKPWDQANRAVGPVQYLNTERRAAERKGEALPLNGSSSNGGAAPRPRFLSQGEYQKLKKAADADLKKRQAALVSSQAPAAAWRSKVHAARRRTMLVVLTMIRLKRGLHQPKRFMRFGNLGFIIPQLLDEDCNRFIAEQQHYASIRAAISTARSKLDSLLRGTAADPPQPLPGPHASPQPSPKTMPGNACPTACDSLTRVYGSGAGTSSMQRPTPPTLSQPNSRAESGRGESEAAGVAVVTPSTTAPGSATASVPTSRLLQKQTSADSPQSSQVGAGAAGQKPIWGSNLPQRRRSKSAERSLAAARAVRAHRPTSPAPTSPPKLTRPASGQLSSRLTAKTPLSAEPSSCSQLTDVLAPLPGAISVDSPGGQGAGGGDSSSSSSRWPSGRSGSSSRPAPRSSNGSSRLAAATATASPQNQEADRPLPTLPPPTSPLLPDIHAPRSRNSSGSRPPRPLDSTPNGVDCALQLTTGPAQRLPALGGVDRSAAAAAGAQGACAGSGQERSSAPPLRGKGGPQARLPASCGGQDLKADPRGQAGSAQAQGAAAVPVVKSEDRRALMAALGNELDQLFDELKRCTKLLGMYVNRVNGAWAEAQTFGPPHVTSITESTAFMKSDHYSLYKADAMRQLRSGCLAIQVMAAEDYLSVPAAKSLALGTPLSQGSSSSRTGGLQQDLWTADPWELVDSCRPGIMPPTDRIEGLSLGGRILSQLALAVTSAVGPEALARLHVLLCINPQQQEEVVEELCARHYYGLKRDNIILVVQPASTGYRYSPEDTAFSPEEAADLAVPCPSPAAASGSEQAAGPQTAGSGHVLCQMAWAGEAFVLQEDGLPQPLPLPVFEHLAAHKVEWLLSRRARDLGLLSREGALDLPSLAYSLYVRDTLRVAAVLEVMHTTSAVVARQYDSVVLHHTSKGTDARIVAELRQAELVTPSVISAVEAVRGASGAKGLAVGLQRYTLHLPTITACMASLSSFRPKLSLSREVLHVSLDLADLLSHAKVRTLAMEARVQAGQLMSHTALEEVLPLLQTQDHDPAFRDVVLRALPAEPAVSVAELQAPILVAGNRSHQKSGYPLIVFIAKNSISTIAVAAAANLARAGRDLIQLVTFVPTEAQRGEGDAMLAGHRRAALRAMVDVRVDVLVRGASGLLDCMEAYVSSSMAAAGARPLVIMASQQLTSNVFGYVVGSVTLSMVRRLAGTPVLVVTANTKQLPPKPGMKVMVLAEAHSKNMLGYVCSNLLDQARGDRLLLAQVQASNLVTRQQAANQRRILDAAHTLAFSHQQPVYKAVASEGAMDKAMCEMVDQHGVAIVALQLPPGTKGMPQQMLTFLRCNRAATLVYQDMVGRLSMLRKSGALRRSMNVLMASPGF